MATLSRAESKNMYSWWWDSHISPKNSKWLQQNLTDMDSNVKTMIKLIEVDEDSFARRAEMYYKKRPELMKLVEEFYRAYRALAERYDHATGVIRQAHTTMAEAFPNQVPFLMTDDGPVNLAHSSDPQTPEMRAPVRASIDPDELVKGAVGLSSSDFLSVKRNGDLTKGSKQLNGLGKARKGLNFHEVDNDHVKCQALSESERLGRSETDIQALQETLAKLEAEKEAGLLQYQQTLERLSKLESEVSQANENSKGLNERASKAEAEVQSLKETLEKVEAERETSLLQYQQYIDRISNLESYISRAERDAEKETESLKEELTRVKAEKEALLGKYMEALEKIANLENKLLLAEDYASGISDRADKAEKEVETLRETITRLTQEKEDVVLKCDQCLEKITILEAEVQDGAAKLKGSEEQCLLLDRSNKSLQSEMDSLMQKVGMQNQELSEKQKEMGRLWTCVQEERMRFMEAETSFQSLQNLHSKVQEELRSVVSELQRKVQLLKDMEIQNQHLEDEVQKVKNENKGMQDEIFDLKEGKGKLKQELELRVDQRNALQQEIYFLKEELSRLSQRHRDVMGQVESVGYDPESLGSSVKELQDENSNLKETCQRNDVHIADLAEKLGVMEKLLEKNEFLENSLSDLQAELEGAREKMKVLEESFQLLTGEKSTLITQLQITTESLEKLSERNTFLENSLFDANAELEMLRVKSKNLEDSCMLLNDQNSVLVTEKQTLASQLETTQQRLEDLGKIHADLELSYSGLEEEREVTLCRVKELQVCLDVEKQEHADSSHSSQKRIADLEKQIHLLQEVGDHMREEFEEELDKAVNAQFDIFILQKCIQDMKDENSSLLKYCEKLLEASNLSEKLISELEHTSLGQEEEVRVLTNQTKVLRTGLFQLLEAVETAVGPACDGHNDEDQGILQYLLGRLDSIKTSLCEAWDENQELVIQKSVLMALLWQLRKDVADLSAVIIILRQEIGTRNGEILVIQKEMQKLLESNEELILKVRESNQKEVLLLTEMESLREKVFNLQRAYEDLQKENFKVIEDKESLIKACENLEEEKHNLENLSFVFKNVMSDKATQVMELTENIDRLCNDNAVLVEKVGTLEVSLKKSENELEEATVVNDQLKDEIDNGKDLLCLKEMKLAEADAMKINQENQILQLSENYDQQLKECESLCEFIEHLDSQMLKIQKKYEGTEARTTVLSSELQKGKDEVKLWETVAGTFFTELQSCSVREALIKEKYSELIRAYEFLEEESHSKCIDIVQLRERVGALEGENSDVKAQLAADHSAILSLRDSVASLEKQTIQYKKVHKTDSEDKEDAEHCQNLSDYEVTGSKSGGFTDLQEVQARVQAVEKAIIELKQHAKEEFLTVRSDLDSAMRQIEILKSQSGSRCGSGRLSKRFASHPESEDLSNGSTDGHKLLKTSPNISEPVEELLMKDIVLDQASDSSSFGKNRKTPGSNDGDKILKVWEPIDQGGSTDLIVGKPYKSDRPSSESTVDKELCVDDQQEVSKRFPNPNQQDDHKRKTLERLASDVQKLTNLQITVQDLKAKLVMTEECSSKGKGSSVDENHDGIKDQLMETEETISKLFDYSGKLMKKIENSSSSASSFDGSIAADSSDGGGSARRRRCSEQARRISEKIGRLQVEVQKVQFLLMKLDTNKAGKGGTQITERSTRILLRDYLYGGGSRTPRRRMRTRFCGCAQPPTMGD